MSQNSTTPTTDENRLSSSTTARPNPVVVPVIPISMYFPYANTNTGGQPYFAPTVYPNVPSYSSVGNHHPGNFGLSYGAYYPHFYSPANNILPGTTRIGNSSAVVAPHPLMMPTLIPMSQRDSLTTRPLMNENESERNKNLNIRECQSPVLVQTKQQRKPLVIVNPSNIALRSEDHSSSPTPLISHAESEQNLLPHSTSSFIQEIDSDNLEDDFLTFIEQKTKIPTIMPELNPLASEFSFENSQTTTQDSTITTNGIDHDQQDQENHSSYRVLFDNLIEKSLESIEAIKKSRKVPLVHDVSIQCSSINDSTNRSTQTIETANHRNNLMEEYSQRTIDLMETLLDNFRTIYQYDQHDQCQSMARTCDELRYLILFLHQIILSSKNESRSSANDLDTPFNNLIDQLANDMTYTNRYQSSSQIVSSAGRGTARLMTSTGNSPLPSFSCRQINPVITTTSSKLCLLCRKALDDTDDVMHKLCRAFSSSPHVFNDA